MRNVKKHKGLEKLSGFMTAGIKAIGRSFYRGGAAKAVTSRGVGLVGRAASGIGRTADGINTYKAAGSLRSSGQARSAKRLRSRFNY